MYSSGQTAAAGFSTVLDGAISHDKTTRFLASEFFDEKTLWKKVKKIVRAYEREEGCLIFDDTVIEKPSKENRAVKGISLLNVFYHGEKGGQTVRLPTGYRIIAKTEEYRGQKSGELKRKSPVTKNEMMREMIKRHIQNQVKFTFVLADSWYSSAEKNAFYRKKEQSVYIWAERKPAGGGQ